MQAVRFLRVHNTGTLRFIPPSSQLSIEPIVILFISKWHRLSWIENIGAATVPIFIRNGARHIVIDQHIDGLVFLLVPLIIFLLIITATITDRCGRCWKRSACRRFCDGS